MFEHGRAASPVQVNLDKVKIDARALIISRVSSAGYDIYDRGERFCSSRLDRGRTDMSAPPALRVNAQKKARLMVAFFVGVCVSVSGRRKERAGVSRGGVVAVVNKLTPKNV